MKKTAAILITVFFFLALSHACADTLYLKNGRSIEGIFKGEKNNEVELEVNSGVIKFRSDEVAYIVSSDPAEKTDLRKKWQNEKLELEKRFYMQQAEEEKRPKKVDISSDGQKITVNAIINDKVNASLIMDTGASVVMLRRKVAEELGLDLDKSRPAMKVTLADGRQVEARTVVLKSVKVENAQADNVEAAVIDDESESLNVGDGLLGMSFLSRFNFKVDYNERKLILEKL